MNNMPKFAKVAAWDVIQYLEKGYEIIAQHQEAYKDNTSTMNGTFMGNSVNLTGLPTVSMQTYYVMKRGAAAEVLYGEKNENKPANT